MNRTLSRAILAASALLICRCSPTVTGTRVQYGNAAAALQLTIAGPVDKEGATVALERFAATVATCRAYSTSVTYLENKAEPLASRDAEPQVTSTVGGVLVCTN